MSLKRINFVIIIISFVAGLAAIPGCKQRRERSSFLETDRSDTNAVLMRLADAIAADSRQVLASSSGRIQPAGDGIALDDVLSDREIEALQAANQTLRDIFTNLTDRLSDEQMESVRAAAHVARDICLNLSLRLEQAANQRRAASAGDRQTADQRATQNLESELRDTANHIQTALNGNSIADAHVGLQRLLEGLTNARGAVQIAAAAGNIGSSNAQAAIPASPYQRITSAETEGDTTAPIVKNLGAGAEHSCALKQSRVYCWGRNNHGQVGDQTTSDRWTPVLVMERVKALSVGDSHNCAIDMNNRASCWGLNFSFQTGVATPSVPWEGPRDVDRPTLVEGLGPVKRIVAGKDHTCAIKFDHTVVCFGYNEMGQLGIPADSAGHHSRVLPRQNSIAGLTGVIDLALGELHTCALKNDRTVRCWGSNGHGQLANASVNATASRTGRPIAPENREIRGVEQLVAYGETTCAKRADLRVICWGEVVRDERNRSPIVPFEFTDSVGGSAEIAVGPRDFCGLMLSNAVICVQRNRVPHPDVTVEVPADADSLSWLSVGERHRCAIKNRDSVICWGENDFGQLGHEPESDDEESDSVYPESEPPTTVEFPD